MTKLGIDEYNFADEPLDEETEAKNDLNKDLEGEMPLYDDQDDEEALN